MNRRRLWAGTSLIEVLTVIVVFLVGILAIVQIFPPGLRILRDTKNNTIASSLAKAEIERVQAHSGSLPEMILPVSYTGSGAFQVVDPAVDPDNLEAPTTSGAGAISPTGQVLLSGVPVGNWARLSGANRFDRVIGEGGPVPRPRQIDVHFGSLIQLMYAPMLYDVDSTTLLGKPGQVVVYGNDLVAKDGDLTGPDLVPQPNDPQVDASTYYVVTGDKAKTTPAFANQDQLWIGAPQTALVSGGTPVPIASTYRIRLTFTYQSASGLKTVDAILIADPSDTASYAFPTGSNYSIISLQQLIGNVGVYGTDALTPANYRGIVPGSVTVERVFKELGLLDAFHEGNPYEYKVLSLSLGAILVNQFANEVRVTDASGNTSPLVAKVDYTIYDNRVIRDEFRAPDASGGSVKLALNSIKSFSGGTNPDGLPAKGIGGQGNGDLTLWTPDVNSVNGSQDFVLQDLETGGVIVGNNQDSNRSAYYVDKTRGVIVFKTVDPSKPTGLWAYIAFPTQGRVAGTGGFPIDPTHIWTPTASQTEVNISGRPLRALYRGNGEFAVQVLKAARSYRQAYPSDPTKLNAGEMFVAGSYDGTHWGLTAQGATRLYFPLADYGQRVVVGEANVTNGSSTSTLQDVDLLINQKYSVNGVPVASYATLPNGLAFDTTAKGYAIRWVRGSSVKVRTLWNPESFALTSDPTQNFQNFQDWSHSWRKVSAETIQTGAAQ